MSAVNERERPPLVVFDGVCVLCRAGLRWILRHDRRRHWRFAAMQTPQGAALLREAGIDPTRPATFLVRYAGRFHVESDACLVIARDVGGVWRGLAAFGKLVPRALRDRIYRLIARNRYRWFGRSDACYVPAPHERHRFLGG